MRASLEPEYLQKEYESLKEAYCCDSSDDWKAYESLADYVSKNGSKELLAALEEREARLAKAEAEARAQGVIRY